MASKSDNKVSKPVTTSTAGPAAKARSKAKAPASPPPAEAEKHAGAKGLLRAGLKALNDVRDDVVTRQSRVFEALLGIDTSHAASERSARDWKLLNPGGADGMQKFEEIFDQRVARSLERLGMPSPQALATLVQQLEAINEHLKRIEPAPARRAPSRKKTSRP